MDPRLLEYYNKELIYMRELANEFAQAHPKIARRLGMQAGEMTDPYVERLIEGFSFMAARMQIKIDAEFPRFTGRMLEVVYPNYVRPTPSMAVARYFPDPKKGNLGEGLTIERGATLMSRIPPGENTACEFRTSQDVTLYPLEIVSARLTGIPPDIPMLDRYVPPHAQVRSALRLRLRVTEGEKISELAGLDRLPFYLSGDEQVASHLFELLHAGGVATITGEPGAFGDQDRPFAAVTHNAVVHEGLGVNEGLLPLNWSKFHGHNLLHEYFACPSRFYFFTLTGLQEGLRKARGREAEIVVLLSQSGDRLAGLVDASRFALFCTPVINLFPRKIERVELKEAATEFHMVPKRLAPLDYEVFTIDALHAQVGEKSAKLEFRPLYQTLNNDEGNHGRYFCLRRERRLLSDSARRYGTRTPYIGTEVFVSLVDQFEAPYHEGMRYLSIDAWLTNRDLPNLVPRDGLDDLEPQENTPVAGIGLIRPPSTPRAPFAERETAWRLIRQLNFNSVPLEDSEHRPGGQGLRDMLRLFISGDDTTHQRQVEGLLGVKTRPVSRKLPGAGPLVFGRGTECQLTVDESGFSGGSPFLFGLILEHYLARHVSINSFTQTELQSMQRGRIMRWPVRMGTRGVV
ncbi:type VI secretion system baseplate subunit TssF [Paraburkholderia tropica]|uniref:Type VI secretion system protein ImpG n=1 Tax=Paraburkholderia tropica TaxID=92647 RepID=A0AAQ1GFU1_9BURK|nr:type VI secretion system baseplate subunit TssF [Paraburkholderia tropica]RQN39301.1 type VI secretion system baseplate subunit TssF [Paraburkholderia tropica]SEJ70345.1 type VI secretion system protein ImpG [Paraburkholderia tropica]